METFESIFGIRKEDVKPSCLLLPCLPAGIESGLKAKFAKKGKIYSCANSENITLIHTRIGAPFVGDAVLYLQETACSKIMLFGSCGAVSSQKDLGMGTLFAPAAAFSFESFTLTLLGKNRTEEQYLPDNALLNELLSSGKEHRLKSGLCATVGSLKLEERDIGLYKKNNIEVLDMECSAFFAACGHTGKKAAALFYVSDILGLRPLHLPFSSKELKAVTEGIREGTRIIELLLKNA